MTAYEISVIPSITYFYHRFYFIYSLTNFFALMQYFIHIFVCVGFVFQYNLSFVYFYIKTSFFYTRIMPELIALDLIETILCMSMKASNYKIFKMTIAKRNERYIIVKNIFQVVIIDNIIE